MPDEPADLDKTLTVPAPEEKPETRPSATGRWEPPTPDELRLVLPQYEITVLLGRGGMGAVYRGMQINLDRPVAIKILPALGEDGEEAAQFAARFKNEARAMGKLNHPGIVKVYDFGETPDGLLYIVMEFIEGTDVQKMMAGQGRLHSAQAMAITAHVCDALHYAHERGIVHRDIKPANIMVGNDGVVKVADFGLAKMSRAGESGLTRSGMTMGTLHYMAPEALMLGIHVDHRADIYAVGVMLYHMLTGRLPQGIFKLPSEVVPGLDPRFDAVVAKALREDRDLRQQSTADLRADLDGILTRPIVKMDASASPSPASRTAGTAPSAPPRLPGPQPLRQVVPPQEDEVHVVQRRSLLPWVAVVVLTGLVVWLGGDRQLASLLRKSSGPATAEGDAASSRMPEPEDAKAEASMAEMEKEGRIYRSRQFELHMLTPRPWEPTVPALLEQWDLVAERLTWLFGSAPQRKNTRFIVQEADAATLPSVGITVYSTTDDTLRISTAKLNDVLTLFKTQGRVWPYLPLSTVTAHLGVVEEKFASLQDLEQRRAFTLGLRMAVQYLASRPIEKVMATGMTPELMPLHRVDDMVMEYERGDQAQVWPTNVMLTEEQKQRRYPMAAFLLTGFLTKLCAENGGDDVMRRLLSTELARVPTMSTTQQAVTNLAAALSSASGKDLMPELVKRWRWPLPLAAGGAPGVTAPVSPASVGSVQSWTDAAGRQLSAKFVRLENGQVTLEVAGRPSTFPLARLSPASQALATSLAQRVSAGAAPSTSVPGAVSSATDGVLHIHSLQPGTPAGLKPGERLKVGIRYDNTLADGVQIWARPYTQGSRTPGYTAHSSIIYPRAKGELEGWFSFHSNVAVDEVRVEMVDVQTRTVLATATLPIQATWTGAKDIPVTRAPATTPRFTPTIQPGETMDLKFTAVDGRAVDLAALRGKVVLIDFWATWCGPCVADIPTLLAAYQKHHAQGFEIIGISLDSDVAALNRMTQARGMSWPQHFDGLGWQSPVARKYGIRAVPTMWLINKDGQIASTDARHDLAAQVAMLLGESGSASPSRISSTSMPLAAGPSLQTPELASIPVPAAGAEAQAWISYGTALLCYNPWNKNEANKVGVAERLTLLQNLAERDFSVLLRAVEAAGVRPDFTAQEAVVSVVREHANETNKAAVLRALPSNDALARIIAEKKWIPDAASALAAAVRGYSKLSSYSSHDIYFFTVAFQSEDTVVWQELETLFAKSAFTVGYSVLSGGLRQLPAAAKASARARLSRMVGIMWEGVLNAPPGTTYSPFRFLYTAMEAAKLGRVDALQALGLFLVSGTPTVGDQYKDSMQKSAALAIRSVTACPETLTPAEAGRWVLEQVPALRWDDAGGRFASGAAARP